MRQTTGPRVGVLALQGDVREHLRALESAGARPVAVRRPGELAGVDGLVLPGGESTTMVKLARLFEVFEPLRLRIREGLPVLGTCAGMIMLADRILDGTSDQETLGGLDITVRRNAFGRQVDSFETDLEVEGVAEPVHAVFIRAPWVEQVGERVRVLARVPAYVGPDRSAQSERPGEPERSVADGRIVAVRQGPLLATSFHPEVGGDDRIHRLFLDQIEEARAGGLAHS